MRKHRGKHAWTVKVGERGQFVVPKEARDVFGIEPGDTLILLGDVKRGLAILPSEKVGMFMEKFYMATGSQESPWGANDDLEDPDPEDPGK